MITSHLQPISDHDIRAAVGWMRVADPAFAIPAPHPRPVTPVRKTG